MPIGGRSAQGAGQRQPVQRAAGPDAARGRPGPLGAGCGMSVPAAPVATSQLLSTDCKSASVGACRYCWVELVPVVGLLNSNGVGWILVLPLGHSRWYEAPSKPVLVNVQPCTLNSSASLAGKQKRPSPSAFTALSPRPPNSPFRQAVG